jgi:ComF family protein
MQLLAHALSKLLDALAPPGCAACDAPCSTTFCSTCSALTPAAPPSSQQIDGVPLLVAGTYAPPLSTAITRFKYEARPELSRYLSTLLLPGFERLALPSAAVLVPVPMHPRRLASRGYNQAALLAQELAKRCRKPCQPRLLCRARETERQVGKSRTLRLTNAQGAFALRGSGGLGSRSRGAPAHVVLVDDVVTTGSTVRACAQALAAGGVQLVAVVALARAVAR